MKEIRIESRIKNNILYRAIFDNYESVAGFCRVHDLDKVRIGALINLKKLPYLRMRPQDLTIRYSDLALTIASIVGIPEEELFPVMLYKSISKTRVVREISLNALPESAVPVALGAGFKTVETRELQGAIEKALKTLAPRQAEIVSRAMDGENLTEIAKDLGISRSRVSAVHEQALRLLRHPSRSWLLKEYHTIEKGK